ncbi:hypothetical protein EfmGK923_16470 [Enterococcus faecium]|uniref:solute carrier family 23 protein n=1 Tax=Enterococcus faecium TaxID=1352 RepID=UPI0021FC1E52|nr:solute carrier family 23 protein [Enterococcus faecium]BDP91474.1 hypothetical protein EfmGK923_16470 [Enterococcus faecium]
MEKETQNGKAAVLGLQHLLAMYAGAVAVPLLICSGVYSMIFYSLHYCIQGCHLSQYFA